ncbi:hypothetical protein RRG08_045399 [Elysia crispata]|uniref:Uncharacterized protein n=1 Tax=Elysia crispata TaxID=231223 RepID=A0AAE1AN22_9GAST|nr:hypothetical protein RRG08_045399 [Elysia crispata]
MDTSPPAFLSLHIVLKLVRRAGCSIAHRIEAANSPLPCAVGTFCSRSVAQAPEEEKEGSKVFHEQMADRPESPIVVRFST